MDVFYELRTQSGSISLDKAVMGALINREIAGFRGKVLLSNSKGRPFKTTGGGRVNDDGNFFEFSWSNDGGLNLKVFVVIRLGGSIHAVTTALIAALRGRIGETMGFRVDCVSIVVKGMLAQNISRRDIEVKG
jgi:uncharacterized alkaline shock family protein YloU